MQGALVRGAFVLAVSACASASGDVQGGEARYDAASPAAFVPPITEPTYADAAPTSWKGVYREFFGRRSKASCAGNGTCHDAAGKAGARASNFVCADADGCYASLRTAKSPEPKDGKRSLVEEADVATPENAYLFSILRLRTDDGVVHPNRGMPQIPIDFIYSAANVDVMKAWIKAGAKDD